MLAGLNANRKVMGFFMWICEKCGKENSGKFCVSCGQAKTNDMPNTQSTAAFDGGVTVRYKNNTYSEENENKNVKQKKKKVKKIYIVLSVVAAVIILLFGGLFGYYASAKSDLKNGRYAKAEEKFGNIAFFLNSKKMAKECVYEEAVFLMDNKNYKEAIEKLEQIKDYEKYAQTVDECKYLLLSEYRKNDDYKAASELMETMGDIKKGDRLYETELWCSYSYAKSIIDSDAFKARELLEKIKDDYSPAEDLILECTYKIAKQYETDGEYEKAFEEFEKCGEYKDSGYLLNTLKSKLLESAYAEYENGNYEESKKLLEMGKDAPASDEKKIAAYELFIEYKTAEDMPKNNKKLFSYLTEFDAARKIVEENEDLLCEFLYGRWQENGNVVFEVSSNYEIKSANVSGKIKYSSGRIFANNGKAFLYDFEIISENKIRAKAEYDSEEHIFTRQ